MNVLHPHNGSKKASERETPVDSLPFRFMSLGFTFRDLIFRPKEVLETVGVKPGFLVLDYGCGPGSYSIPGAELVGKSGRVYALDVSPLAVRWVQRNAAKKELTNIETILSDCETALPGGSIDIVLLYDTLHDLRNPDDVLREIHRVLKPSGILSVSDHHMKDSEILGRVTADSLFRLEEKSRARGKRIYRFSKG